MKEWITGSGARITQVLNGRSNVFLLSCHGKNVLVDTSRKRYRIRLVAALAKKGVEYLEALVLTHTHFDHADNAAFIREKFRTRVIVHTSEADFLRRGISPLPAGTVLPTRILLLLARRMGSFFDYDPCLVDREVHEEFDFSGIGRQVRLLHTPGHSPGSVSLVVDDEIALVGDAMFGVFPCSVFPPFADDVERLVSSWGKLLDTGCRLFIPAHGSAVDRSLLEKCYGRGRR
jgi:hydroxyacylglutathione hydrolase